MSWWDRAACAEHEPELWFPAKGQGGDAAKAICCACSVRIQCLSYAMRHPSLDGIWGGWSPEERRRLRRMVEEIV